MSSNQAVGVKNYLDKITSIKDDMGRSKNGKQTTGIGGTKKETREERRARLAAEAEAREVNSGCSML